MSRSNDTGRRDGRPGGGPPRDGRRAEGSPREEDFKLIEVVLILLAAALLCELWERML